MNKKPSKASFYWKLFLGGVAVILLILFLCFGCEVDFGALGPGFSIGGLLGG